MVSKTDVQADATPSEGGVMLANIKLVTRQGAALGEWQGHFDLQAGGLSNTAGLLDRLRLLMRRELIARSLIVPTDEDKKRVR